jgi:hypothetical protein
MKMRAKEQITSFEPVPNGAISFSKSEYVLISKEKSAMNDQR